MARGPARQSSRERFEKRRWELADIAARVFAERGYHDTSVAELVKATGLQRGGLYYYISSKQELLVLIHHRFMEPLLKESYMVLDAGKPPEQTIRMLAHVLLGSVDYYRAHVTVFLREWRNIRPAPEWDEIITVRKEYENLILRELQKGKEAGVFSISDEKMTLMSFLGMINYTYQWFDPEGRVSVEDLADQMSSIFLYGITRRDQSEQDS